MVGQDRFQIKVLLALVFRHLDGILRWISFEHDSGGCVDQLQVSMCGSGVKSVHTRDLASSCLSLVRHILVNRPICTGYAASRGWGCRLRYDLG